MSDSESVPPRPPLPPTPTPPHGPIASPYPSPQAYPGPQTYPTPQGYPGPQGYPSPPGFAAPYGNPVSSPPPYGPGSQSAPGLRPTAPSPAVGVIAMVAGLAALIIPALVVGIASYDIGTAFGTEMLAHPTSPGTDLSYLTPVRGSVLQAEIAFWAGTVVGVWAIVQGIVAAVKRRGRAAGIVGLVAAALAPIVFGTVLTVGLISGIGVTAGDSLTDPGQLSSSASAPVG